MAGEKDIKIRNRSDKPDNVISNEHKIVSVKLHNKSDKPDNIILKEHEIVSKCEEIQEQLPDFLKGFFRYLKGDVLSKTRFAYLGDIHFFSR